MKERGEIEVLDIDSKPTGVRGRVALVTSDIREAVRGAQVILNPIPYFACEEYARLVAPHLEEGQVVVYLGKGGACLTWAKVLREMKITKKVYLADTNTLPYGASRMGEAQVRLENRTQNLILGTFPGKDVDAVAGVVEQLFTREHGYEIRKGQNAIDSILVDYNAITHTPPMVCNAARIELGRAAVLPVREEGEHPVGGAPDRAHRPGAHGHREGARPEAVDARGRDHDGEVEPERRDLRAPALRRHPHAVPRGLRGAVQAGHPAPRRRTSPTAS